MKIGIHHTPGTFSDGWIKYCEKNQISWMKADCYATDIIKQLDDCDIFMWHFHQSNPKNILFAKQLIYALQCAGKVVFPDFNTCWHFDDKVGQKYLLEAVDAPLVPGYVFYSRSDAMKWASQTKFPKVFKLTRGAGSANVRLVSSREQAFKLVNKAFSGGFRQYNPLAGLNERWRKYKLGKTNFTDLIEGVGRFIIKTDFEKVIGNERGYVYFQDFIPDNKYDIRVNFVYDKCFASRRFVRPRDFRASGSGINDTIMSAIPEKALRITFDVASRLRLQTIGIDFVMSNHDPLIVEISYGFGYPAGQFTAGYWDKDLSYHPGSFDPFGWMVDGIIKEFNSGVNEVKELTSPIR